VITSTATPPVHTHRNNTPWQAGSADLDDDALLLALRQRSGIWIEPVIDPEETRPDTLDALVEGRFHLAGETHTLGLQPDWLNNPSVDVEWHILLHKFYYAPGLAQRWLATREPRYLQAWARLTDGWLQQVRDPGFIASDVTGRRVQNWTYALHLLLADGEATPLDGALVRRALLSLQVQVDHLCAHLTPKRNHRTLELLAIMLAGVAWPAFERARLWRELALRETLANVQADLLPDGVHCELSTDYHHLALRNWLQVRQLAARNGQPVPVALDQALGRALDFALQVHQPSGRLPALSDGDARGYGGLLAEAAELFDRDDLRFVASGGRRGRAPVARVAHFPDAGYHVVRSAWLPAPQFSDAQHLVFDCGPLGEGNHGHFDALSLELAANGQALVVDPGRHTYSEAGPVNWRVHFRGTAAHNTVCVDGRQQTRYEPRPVKDPGSRHASGTLRHKVAGPAPDTVLLEAVASPALDLLHGRAKAHDYAVTHERAVVFVDRCYWLVCDRLQAEEAHGYAVNFQLHPRAWGQAVIDGRQLDSPGLSIAWSHDDGARRRVAPGWVSERYGHKSAAPRLLAECRAADAGIDHLLLPTTGKPRRVSLRRETVAAGGHVLQVRIDGRDGEDLWYLPPRPVQAACIAGLSFSGRWLRLRLDDAGRVQHATSHAGARIDAPVPLALLATTGAATGAATGVPA